MANHSVTVLMSSYNGEKYIREQLDSIVRQENVNLTLIIRDDGSTDNTVATIEEFQSKCDFIHLTAEKNVGALKSFERLIINAPEDEFYAFADQDDIWDADKLSIAIQSLLNLDKPAVYYSNQNCIAADGSFLYRRFPDENLQPSFLNTLFGNRYAGCTMVLNRALIEKIQKAYAVGDGKIRSMHDGLALIVAQLIGETVYDSLPHMSFRRHGGNYSEAQLFESMPLKRKTGFLLRKLKTMKRVLSSHREGYMTDLCSTLYDAFQDELQPDDRAALIEIAQYSKSTGEWIRFLFKNKFYAYFPKPKIVTYLKFVFRMY